MLTVELKDAPKVSAGLAEVEIYCDEQGLDELLRQLQYLKTGESHIHLMTASWAGHELDEVRHGEETVLVHHLKVTIL